MVRQPMEYFLCQRGSTRIVQREAIADWPQLNLKRSGGCPLPSRQRPPESGGAPQPSSKTVVVMGVQPGAQVADQLRLRWHGRQLHAQGFDCTVDGSVSLTIARLYAAGARSLWRIALGQARSRLLSAVSRSAAGARLDPRGLIYYNYLCLLDGMTL